MKGGASSVPNTVYQEKISRLLELSHEIGRESRQLAILGEGNTSVRLNDREFAIKASGATLAGLRAAEVSICRSAPLLSLLNRGKAPDGVIEQALLNSRARPGLKKPSVEATFHAWLLSIPGIEYVGHCHPVAVNQVLCSRRARHFASRRLFPDEIVCCGPASVLVGYSDPGLPLAAAIQAETERFIRRHGFVPRLILLQNHGLIGLGRTAQGVLAALLMANKAAAIFLGAAVLGGPVFLAQRDVVRIRTREDEGYRQRQLKIE